MLRAEYFSVEDDGTLLLLTENDSDMSATAEAFSAANVSDLIAHSSQQYVTISGAIPGIQQFLSTNVNTSVNTLTSFVNSNVITGVDIDFENFSQWSASDYTNFKAFVNKLYSALHANGNKLIICGPVWTSTGAVGASNPFANWNYADFVGIVDYMSPMTYDYMWDFGAGAPVQPLSWLQTWCQYMKSIFPVSQIIMGIPAYGYVGTPTRYDLKIKTFDQITHVPGFSSATRDSSSAEMTFTSNGKVAFYCDQTSLNTKRSVVKQEGINAVSVWHLGGNPFF
jgi:spore germination protein YaaH